MSEKIINQVAATEKQSNSEVDQKFETYLELTDLFQNCEEDGRAVADTITKLRSVQNPDEAKIAKFKAYFELDESTIADAEKSMRSLELGLGYGPNRSTRFNDNSNDILVNSAIFYHDRIVDLKDATGEADVDKSFIEAIIEYAHAVEYDETSYLASRYDDIAIKQEYIQNCQKRRSNCHNAMIQEVNKLNDAASKVGIKPLMYRNLATNSVANGYRNDAQMYHDRVSLAHYVSKMIDNNHDITRLPDPKYIKET